MMAPWSFFKDFTSLFLPFNEISGRDLTVTFARCFPSITEPFLVIVRIRMMHSLINYVFTLTAIDIPSSVDSFRSISPAISDVCIVFDLIVDRGGKI